MPGDAPFDARRAALADALRALLGASAPRPVADAAHAARLAAEYRASRADAAPSDWGLLARAWDVGQTATLVDTLHRVMRNVGERGVWLLALAPDAQAVPASSGAVLDNPLGFAAATDDRLALLDAEVPAGLTLVRAADRWELEVWGEPWLSATTRALRGVG